MPILVLVKVLSVGKYANCLHAEREISRYLSVNKIMQSYDKQLAIKTVNR